MRFNIIKEKLCSIPTLELPKFENKYETPFHFYSKKVIDPIKKQINYELKFYAIIKALQAYEQYLIQQELILFTNHYVLKCVYNK